MLKQFSYIFLMLIALSSWIHGAEAQDTTAPTVSINTPSGTQTEAFNVTVTFSESVTGFIQSELVVTGSSAATITNWDAQTGGINYVATITPVHDGNVVLNVAANVAEDASSNGNTAATQQTVRVLIPETVWMPDENLRTLVRNIDHLNIPDGTALTQADMKRASFNGLTAGLDSDISDLTGLEYATQLTSINLSDNNITDLTPLAGLTNLTFLQLDENYGITDFSALAGLTKLTQLELNYTDIAGTDLASLAGQLTDLTDLTLGLRGNYIEDITPLEDLTGLVVLYLHDNDITDLTPLGGLTGLKDLDLSANFALSDLTPLSSLTNLEDLDLSANFALNDLTGLESCESLKVLNLRDTPVLRDLTPIQDLALTELDIGKVFNDFSYFGRSGPNVSIMGERSGATYDVIITFSEAVEGFELTDLQITGGSATSFVELDEEDGDPDIDINTDELRYNTPMAVYGTTMTPDAGVSEVVITLSEGALQAKRRAVLRYLYKTRYNAGENLIIKLPAPLSPATADTSQHGADPVQLKEPNTALEAKIDTLRPSVDIIVPDGTHKDPFDVTVKFDEAVTDFVQSELVVSGTSGATITQWDAKEGGTDYVATITPTQTGTAIFNVAANVAKDETQNENTTATQKTVQVDKTPPTVSIDAPSGPQGGAFDVTVEFSETVTGFIQSELVVSGTSGASITSWAPQTGGTDYVATITPTQTGTAIFNVAANVAKDAVENLNTAATQQTVQVDKTPPTVSINTPSGPQGGAFDVTVVFSEEVSGFVQSELVVSGTSGSTITDWDAETGGTNYIATITPTQTGTAIFNVATGVAEDAAENPNTAATQQTVQVDKTPPTVSINVPSGTQGGTFDVTVVFNEEVTGFVQSELVVSGTSNGSITAWNPQTGGTHYQATVTSTQTGTAIFNVAANVAEDTAKNMNTAATQKTVQVDTDLPSVSIDVPSDPQGGAFDVTVEFNEAVSNFVQSELVVSGTSGASITSWIPQTGGTTYVATITPTQTGTAIFNVAANVAQDGASNSNTMATQQTVQVDMTRPTVRIDVPSAPQGDAFDVTVIFSEEVTGFVQSELVVGGTSGSTITNWDAETGGTNYVATITPTQTGTAIFNVATGVAEDAAENLNTAATQQTVEVDQTHPTVRIDVPSNAQGGPFNVTVVFSETVTGFVQGELVVSGTSGASITSWDAQTGGTTYIAMITPSQTGTAIFNVAANVAQDAAENLNTAATQQSVQVDMTRPTVRIDVPSNTQNGAFDVTVIFSESMTEFIQSELIVSGTSGASITSWAPQTGGTDYVATITPTQTGTVIFNVAANVAEDAAKNMNTAATQQTVQIDMTRPTANINVPLVPQNGVFDVSIEFSEAVTGFVQSELVVSGTSGASITSWAPETGGITYVATITPSQTGTAIFNVAANVAQDAVENLNAAATQQTVEVDTIRPEVSIIAPSDEQYGSFDVTVTFTEPVTGFVQSELVVGGTSGASITNWDPQTGGRNYIATITPSQTGMTNFNVAENVAMDAAGNLNTAATAKATAVDLDRPHVSLIVPSTPQRETFDVQVTFTEPVNGFTQDDLEISGTSGTHIIKWVAKTDRIDYVATLEPIQSGMVMFYVPENVAEDSAGNLNLPSLQQTVEIDMTRPTVNIRLPTDVERDVFEVMVKFSEPVNGFFEDELLMSNPDDVIIIDWEAQLNKQEYVCTMTPKQGKNFSLIFSIEANVARDDAGNGNEPTQAEVFPIDTQAPCLTIEVNQDVQTGPFDANIAFSEPVTGFSQNDLRLGGMLEARITKWRAYDNGANYLATIAPSPLKRTNTAVAMDGGTVTLHVPNGVAVDEADNENQSVAVKTVTVIFSKDGEDTTRPSGTIQTPTDTQAGAFDITIVFTEPVEDFSQENLNITPSDTNIKNWTSHPDQCCYIATIEPFTSGTVKLNIAENVAMDEAGNGNHAIADKDVEVLFPITADTEKPTVTIAVPTENPSGTFDINIAFSEPVTGFRQNDLQVSDPCFPITQWQADPNRQHYTASITPIQDGTVTFRISDRVAQDAFDNWNTAAVVVSVTAEVSPIHVYVEAPTTVRDVFEVTVVFTEPVIGFTQEDLLFVDDSTATASITAWDAQPGRTRYTATFTPTKNGALVLTVPANAVETGNTNSEPIKVLISPEDVNQDGLIDLQDLNLVTNNLGAYIPNERENNPDVNRDGFVTSNDLALVQAQIDENSRNAPAGLRTVQSLLEDLNQLGNFHPVLLPKTTALLPNYPNPFNPETWIPYQLSTDSHVRINIYDIYGTPIRFIELGNQSAGYYTDKNRAVYWDGTNDVGERVANGIYFYQLQADSISYLRKMVISK